MDRALSPIERLNLSRNSAELRLAIEELCGDSGPILNITLICSSNQNREQTMCVIDFYPDNPNINLLAMKSGGRIFGYHSVVFNLTLPAEFGCIKGFPTSSPACSCTLHRTHKP
jgi:hypothetical protein